MLAVRNLHAYYGNIHALKGVDIEVEAGEFIAILGPNGAGKSTLMKAIIGVLAQRSGSVTFEGKSIDRLPVAHRIRGGIGIIPEGRQLFTDMTVRENLILGAYARLGLTVPSGIDESVARIFQLFPRLKERQNQSAGSLSGGEAQMVAIGRALMSRPRMLLCDEPSLGLAPLLVREVLSTLQQLRSSGITILLADQNAVSALQMADRAYVLDSGQIVASGSGAKLSKDQRVRKAYLGMGLDTE
jgi:branched-chain amino acid transport system ATP-binding protein